MSDLEQALNGKVPEEVKPVETEVTTEVKAESEEAKPTVEEPASPTEDNDQVAAFKAKAIDETRKRQELEQQVAALQQQQAQPREKPDFWENPEEVISQVTQQFDSRLQQTTTAMSVEVMRSLHNDYDEMETLFIDQANENPALVMQMNQSGNPAKFAYDYAKGQRQVAEMQDPNYREKLKAELKAELEAEKASEIEKEIAKRSELPGSLANDRSVGGTTAATARPELENLIG